MTRNESWAPWNDKSEYTPTIEGRTKVEVLGHNDIELVTELAWWYDEAKEKVVLEENQQLTDIAYNNDLEAICDHIKDIEI